MRIVAVHLQPPKDDSLSKGAEWLDFTLLPSCLILGGFTVAILFS